MTMLKSVSLAAIAGLLAVTAPQAADFEGRAASRPLTVTRVTTVVDCSLRPIIVAPGRRGMGEPGTYFARWEYGVPAGCERPIR
ncbi:MAG: hypothetical protein K2X62_04305 [Beijerinckiaceae bacterium]|jgi:hypothetical protein|nr:hypothetical protein [Beijerinckiaceae bacterium]